MTDLPDFNGQDVEREVIEHDEAATERSVARRIALQVLYEVDCAGHNPAEVIDARLQDEDLQGEDESREDLSRKGVRYLRRLVAGVLDHRQQFDTVIQQYASEWPLGQVAIVDRNILRMAIYELVFQTNTPISVVIAEAVELAGLFGAEAAPRFVNGVLGAMAGDVDSVRETLMPRSGG